MKKIIAIAAVLFFASVATAYAQDGEDAILGTWLTAKGKSHVKVYKCGANFCGKIVWLKEPNKNGKPKVDDKNDDENLRSRPIMGLVILKQLKFEKKNRKGQIEYKDGRIYDPEKGKTYRCTAKVDGNMMYFRGYLGPLFRSSQWKRVG